MEYKTRKSIVDCGEDSSKNRSDSIAENYTPLTFCKLRKKPLDEM